MTLLHGDACEVLETMDVESVDAVITDPPYELGFMGKAWDRNGIAFRVALWEAVLRVLKPGGHLLAFGGTRTYHRMACAIEDAGFEVRDCLMWIYGSGFPKSLDVSKAIDKAAGAEREVLSERLKRNQRNQSGLVGTLIDEPRFDLVTSPATPAAQQWQGWGTALKPAYEPILLARKPLMGTVAANVQRYGTGAINVDGCRIGNGSDKWCADAPSRRKHYSTRSDGFLAGRPVTPVDVSLGRWPANILHDGSEDVVGLFPQTTSMGHIPRTGKTVSMFGPNNHAGGESNNAFADTGSAARFFYTAKASRKERGDGNTHPTVKPLALMRWLTRLVLPPGGLVLDPFCGSGSTGLAVTQEGGRFLGIEQDRESADIATQRAGLFALMGSD